jgi:hypothetical protein
VSRLPNPGSDEARAEGCNCPVLDNNHGKWAPWGDDGWWQRVDCPVHGTSLAVEEIPTESENRMAEGIWE